MRQQVHQFPVLSIEGAHATTTLDAAQHEEVRAKLTEIIRRAVQDRQTQRVIMPMRSGASYWAAQELLKLRDAGLVVELDLVLPWGRNAEWIANGVDGHDVLAQADRIWRPHNQGHILVTYDELILQEITPYRIWLRKGLNLGVVRYNRLVRQWADAIVYIETDEGRARSRLKRYQETHIPVIVWAPGMKVDLGNKQATAIALHEESVSFKPCPFCGGEAELTQIGSEAYPAVVSCNDCGAQVHTGDVGWTSPATWNTRAG